MMFSEPTADDYICWLEWHLDKARADAAVAIGKVITQAAAAGSYRSGRTVVYVFEEAFKAFDKGIDTALGELKRAIRITKLDRQELRRITEAELHKFADRIKEVTQHEKLREFSEAKLVNERLAKFDERIRFALRQYDVGFLDPLEPEVPISMNNHINIGVMSGGAVQQGTSHSAQSNDSKVNIELVRGAILSFERELASASVPQDQLAELAAELTTIKAQLTKPLPSVTILREAANSLRNIAEGTIGSALSVPAMTALSALGKALGIA